MLIKYDLNVGALYIRLREGPAYATMEIDDNTVVDLDPGQKLVGIEVISAEHPWPLDQILKMFKVPDYEKEQLRAYFNLPERETRPVQESPTISIASPPPIMVAA